MGLRMNKSLKWELDWIDANLECYESIAHAQRVKRRIEYRYWEKAQAPVFRAQVREIFPEIDERKIESLTDVMIGDVYHAINANVVLVGTYASTMLYLKDEAKNIRVQNVVKNYVAENLEYMEHLFKETYCV